jgi:hypothetical protein
MNEARDQALEAWKLRLLLTSGFESLPPKILAPKPASKSCSTTLILFSLDFFFCKNIYIQKTSNDYMRRS